jgi:hypothetical protein
MPAASPALNSASKWRSNLPQDVRLDHLVRESGQFPLAAGGQLAAACGAADDR